MDKRKPLIITIMFVSLSLLGIVISVLNQNLLFLFICLFILLVSIFIWILWASIEIFIKDKKLDVEMLRNQGLTIVACKNCGKENVKEDKYCIFCGEKVVDSHE